MIELHTTSPTATSSSRSKTPTPPSKPSAPPCTASADPAGWVARGRVRRRPSPGDPVHAARESEASGYLGRHVARITATTKGAGTW